MKLTKKELDLLSTSSTTNSIGTELSEKNLLEAEGELNNAKLSHYIRVLEQSYKKPKVGYPVFKITVPDWVATTWSIGTKEFDAQIMGFHDKREEYGWYDNVASIARTYFSTVPTDFQVLFKNKDIPREVLESMKIIEMPPGSDITSDSVRATRENIKEFKIKIVQEL